MSFLFSQEADRKRILPDAISRWTPKENAVIELTHNWGKHSDDYELGDKYGHIAIGVKDIERICKGLEDNGCKITTKPKTMKNSTTVLAFVEDPDGYKIELIERE